MKKSKLLKSIGFASLAILIGFGTTMAFAPLGASASVANASEMIDQINTKADGENIKYAPSALGLDPENDPVIYTTESGLEIKFGGITVNGTLTSGKLTGYPYITMGTYNSKAINWVIISKSNNIGTGLDYYLFKTWLTKTGLTFSQYFSSNGYETSTPAGATIKTDVESKSYVADKPAVVLPAADLVPINTSLADNTVLALSETILAKSYWNTSSSGTPTTLQSSMTTIYNNSGLSSFVSNGTLVLNSTFSNTVNSTTNYLFPLKKAHAQICVNAGMNFTGYYTDGTNDSWWLYDYSRSTSSDTTYYHCWNIHTDGTIVERAYYNNWGGNKWASGYTSNHGVRPACVIKLV